MKHLPLFTAAFVFLTSWSAFAAPNKPPTIAITSPLVNAAYIVPGSVVLSATASDSDGTVNKVTFYNGNVILSQDTQKPYSYTLSNLAAGTYTLKANATDNKGAVSSTRSVTITMAPANMLPSVSLTSPAGGTTYTAPANLTLQATASDSDGTIGNVVFNDGTTLLGQDTTSPYSYSASNLSLGNHSFYAVATDNKGGKATSASVTITVVAVADYDQDGVPDAVDNCPSLPNADQLDQDGNSIGDACDSDSTCGDGSLDGTLGEYCDDGDNIDGDGCSSTCTITFTESQLTFNDSPTIENCPLFSDQYYFNQRVDDSVAYPALPNSDSMIKNIGLYNYTPSLTSVRPVPRVVDGSQALLPVDCDPNIAWCDASSFLGSQAALLPYPNDLFIVPGSDHHAFVFQETAGAPAGGVFAPNPIAPSSGGNNCYLYETWWTGRVVDDAPQTSPPTTSYTPGSNVTGFTAGSLSIYDLKRDVSYVPERMAGSSASNLPVAAGQVRFDEAVNDDIRHAIAAAFLLVRYGYISPANNAQIPFNCAGTPTNQTPFGLAAFAYIRANFPCDFWNANLPAMGQRFRIKPTFDETPYLTYPIALAWIHAGKRYGLIATDGAPGGFLTSADTDPRWTSYLWPDMQQIKNIPLSAFEAIQSGPVVDIVTATTQSTPNFPNSAVYQ